MSSQLVLFVCTHNKGRSQIANAFFNQLADPDNARSVSAGLEPVAQVQSEVIEVMRPRADQRRNLASFRTEARLPVQEKQP